VIPVDEDLDRKEVKAMKYTKPELVLVESALRTIQGIPKPTVGSFDAPKNDYTATLNGYEADE
jgi:hypothetical protein